MTIADDIEQSIVCAKYLSTVEQNRKPFKG